MFKSFGLPEIILILVIILIFFGVGKLPQVGEAMGKAIHSFKKAQTGGDEEDTKKSSAKKVNKSKKTT
ncbi:MAG: twin-arginine translocase TatA/TatE family subunit [Dehalococcoidales bacterium]|nr:twin-arginine translocase TatA/TatE family subunit [Dehalococcoidales bacterium]